jgi:hypothetical protein
MAYLVTAPLVYAKDETGRVHHCYQGAVIPRLNDQQREHFLRLGLVEEIAVQAAPEPQPITEAGRKPLKAAPVEAWVEYAVSQGLSRDEAKAKTKQELIDALG